MSASHEKCGLVHGNENDSGLPEASMFDFRVSYRGAPPFSMRLLTLAADSLPTRGPDSADRSERTQSREHHASLEH